MDEVSLGYLKENKELEAENKKLKYCLKLFDNTGRLVKELLEK